MPWPMRYYRPAVLAMFYNQPEQYSIQTDEFEGKVRIRDSYYRKSGEDNSDSTYLSVAFGFRACRNGEWAIAAYTPDFCASIATARTRPTVHTRRPSSNI